MNKVKKIIIDRVVDGKWVGGYHDGNRAITVNGEICDAVEVAKEHGIKIKTKKTDKYRTEHADLGTTLHEGHIEDSGDGVGESQE